MNEAIKEFLDQAKSSTNWDNNIETLIKMNEILLAACEEVQRCNTTEHDDKTYHELLFLARNIAAAAELECEGLVK